MMKNLFRADARSGPTRKLPAAIVAIAALLTAGTMASAQGSPEGSDTQIYSADFGASVRAYLLDNPGVILEVFTLLEQQEIQKKAETQITLINGYADELFGSADPVKGNSQGRIKVVEFFDYSCGYCKAALSEVSQAMAGRDDVMLVLKEFPILGPASEGAARLALAVRAEHGDAAYLGLHNALLSQKGTLNDASLAVLTGAAGYNYQALVERGRADDISNIIAANRRLAQQLGIAGTPAFVFKDEIVGGMMQADRMVATFDRIASQLEE